MATFDLELPTDEELTVPEVNISSPALRAGAFHLGKKCESQNNEYMLCTKELNDPRKCLAEGRAVTACALDFFRSVKKSCYEEFTQYAHCLEKSSGDLSYRYCRNTQGIFDKCALDNLNIERPDFGYFSRAKVHHTDRPLPPKKEKVKYLDVPDFLPDNYPRPPAKFGSRFYWME